MKKIGIDARLYWQTGVGVYLRNFLFNLQKVAPREVTFYVYLLKEDSEKVTFTDKKFIKRSVNPRWHTFGEQTEFWQAINSDKLDLMHFTYFSYPVMYHRPFVATIHDLTPIFFKSGKASTRNSLFYNSKHLAFSFVIRSQIRNAHQIITPTNTVKRQISDIFGRQFTNKITPIYEGVNRELLSVKENASLSKRFAKPFLLYVSNFYPHKNVENLILAFATLNPDLQLILVGPNDFFANKTRQLIDKLGQDQKIIIFNNPKLGDFVWFYKHALALVHPSLSEGFGLPLVEAMYFDLPIVASKIDVFQEILGEQYLAFNPNDVSDIQNKLSEWLKYRSKFDYSQLLPRYSFTEMTKKTLGVYNKAINER